MSITVWDEYTGEKYYSGNKVDAKKLEKLKAHLHDLNAKYPEDEFVEEITLVVDTNGACPDEVLKVLAEWHASRVNILSITLNITELSDVGAEMLSKAKGNGAGYLNLYIVGLETISTEAAKQLTQLKGELCVDLDDLPEAVAELF